MQTANRGRDLRTRAIACVDETLPTQCIQCVRVNPLAIALSNRRVIVRKAQPVKIVEDCRLELGPAPHVIVIFDSQKDPTFARADNAPHVYRVDDMAEVEEAGRRRRKPGYDGAHFNGSRDH